MKKIFIILLIVGISIVVSGIIIQNPNPNSNNENQLKLDLEMKSHFNITEQISINVTLMNVGENSVNISELGFPSIQLFLIDQNETLYNHSLELNLTYRPPFGTTLHVNESVKLSIPFNKISWFNNSKNIYGYKIKNSGNYSIYAYYASEFYDIPVWEGKIKSNVVYFEVTS